MSRKVNDATGQPEASIWHVVPASTLRQLPLVGEEMGAGVTTGAGAGAGAASESQPGPSMTVQELHPPMERRELSWMSKRCCTFGEWHWSRMFIEEMGHPEAVMVHGAAVEMQPRVEGT